MNAWIASAIDAWTVLVREWRTHRRMVAAYLQAGALAVLTLWALHFFRLFFEFTICDPGYSPLSPIMMFQGAPHSHYATCHSLSLAWYDALGTVPGACAVTMIVAILFVGWAAAVLRCRSELLRFALTALVWEIAMLLLLGLLSPIMAYHHCGWGMPCNEQPGGTLLMLHLFTAPFAGYALAVANGCGTPSSQIRE